MTDGQRFKFGKNWQNYLGSITETRLLSAQVALRDLLKTDSLDGESFLDAGCGSGVMSLVALELGAARVQSFDYDSDSVEATRSLRTFSEAEERWNVEQGSLTDSSYLHKLGQFDTVYSWGVIHHTGAMWNVADALPSLVAPGGRLVVAIYNDQGLLSRMWKRVKKFYVSSPRVIQLLMVTGYFVPTISVATLKNIVLRRRLRRPRPRGMSAWHDAVDWVGGYPFEVASREAVIEFYERKGLTLENIVSVGSKQGCNQFVFRDAES